MPQYEVERYELYIQRYRVEAADEVEAITRTYRGLADLVEGSLEFVEIDNDRGICVDEAIGLANELLKIGSIDYLDVVIPAIRSVRKVEEEETNG